MKNVMVFLFGMLCVPTIALADEAVADRLHCDAGLIQVCTTPAADGSGNFLVLTDSRARARTDCDVSQPRGVDLRCVPEADVLAAEKAACETLGNGWHWSERRFRCWQEGNDNPRPPEPPQPPLRVTATIECSAEGLNRLGEEMDQIADAVQVILDLRTLQLRATAVYDRLLECRVQNGASPELDALIRRAADMIATFEPEPVSGSDYTDDFQTIRDQIAALGDRPIVVQPSSDEEENWCTDTVAGVFVCIVLPTVVIGTAIGVGTAVLYDYLEDGSADGILHW